ncbi:InlB B-repeat-containing protein [Porphyromonas uenonis]|uniref:InlB B-repeat-containing protein n=1 Tax=Porphyromonas uenonis TaxID=281920 RepID=UPI000485DB62|nr:hypothetical protein [Porphyromonas uenonis]
MRMIIKPLWLALATLSALLTVVSCVKELAVKEQAVNFDSSLTTEQSQIVKGDSTVTTQLLINEEEVDCPRPTKYSVSFTYDEEAGTLFFLGDSIQSGTSIPLSSLSDLSLTYQAKKLVGNKVDVTVSNDAPKKLSKELVWNILADKTYWVKSEQEGEGEITITGADDLDAVEPDTKLAVTAKPADGWELVTLTANEEDILEDKSFEVTENTIVRATFKELTPETYKVTLVKEGEGDASVLVVFPDGDKKELEVGKAISVPAGTKLSVKVYFNSADFYVPSMTANGADILKSRSFVVTEDTTLKVVGARTLSTKVFMDGRGKVSVTVYDARKNNVYTLQDKPERPDDAQYVLSSIRYLVPGTKLTITAEPADGWELKSITANGVDITASKTLTVTSNTVVKVVFKKRPPIPDVPTPDHIPNEYDYQRNCSIKILMVDQDTVKLPIPVKQYKEYLNIEAVHVKENEIYRRVKFDFSEVALSEQSEGLFRCDFFYIDWSRVIRPFLQVQQKQPLRDYIFSHATVNAVGKAIDGTFRKDKIETLASSDPILASIPELAGSYVLTQLPLAHCSDRTNPLENYLEVICFFKRK